MRTSLKILLLTLAMGQLDQLAHSAPPKAMNATGGAIPVVAGELKVVEKKDWENPAITKPDDPGVDCVANITPEDSRAAANAGVKATKNCLPQADAFTRAGEAASYLAHYYQRYTPYALEMRATEKKGELKDYQEQIRRCVTGQGSCDDKAKAEVLKAMVQYNFGKEIRAQVLEGRTRAELMKSVDLGAKGWRDLGVRAPKILTYKNALRTGTLRKSTFRLDVKKLVVVDTDKLSQAERNKLGADYLTHFNEFLNTYSKTTASQSRWHYVSAKSSALGAQDVFRAEWDGKNLDPRLGKTLVDRNRLGIDERSQNTQGVNEIVKSFKDDLRKEKIERDIAKKDGSGTDRLSVHPAQVAVNDVGLGLAQDKDPATGEWMKPKDVAAALVVTINKAIVETEAKAIQQKQNERVPSSTGASVQPKITPTVSVDVEKFDLFLNAIWPADVALPK